MMQIKLYHFTDRGTGSEVRAHSESARPKQKPSTTAGVAVGREDFAAQVWSLPHSCVRYLGSKK